MHDKRGYFGWKIALKVWKIRFWWPKDELNCIIVLSRVCVMPKGQGRFEETCGTLLTPSSPREAMGNDLYGLYCWPATRLEL